MIAKLKAAFSDPTTRRQAVRYLVVGVASAVIEYGLFALLERVFGQSIAVSNFVAMGVAVIFNFLASRFWTFGTEETLSARDLLKSAVPYALLFAFNNVATTWLIDRAVGLGVDSLIAKFVAMGLVVVWNFFAYRLVIFRAKS